MAEVLEGIEEIKKVSFKAGDVVVLISEQNLTDNRVVRIRKQMKEGLPPGVKTVLLEGGLSIQILSKEEG